jgi:translation initiation factor 5
MYDQDILDEESILEWGESKPSKKYISKELSAEMKATSKKLIEWLKTAESESEEESSDDDIEMTDKKVIDPAFILFLSFSLGRWSSRGRRTKSSCRAAGG